MTTNNKQLIKNIAIVQTGIYRKPAPNGEVRYLQAKHFDSKGSLKKEEALLPEIPLDQRVEKHLLQDKDLLLIAKGQHNQACLYRSNWGPAVGSSVFFIIRITTADLLPEYVQWYFNSSHMQLKLTAHYKGTSIPSIPKSALMEMRIPTPPLAIQRNILDIDRLWERERELTRRLLREKELYYERGLMGLIG